MAKLARTSARLSLSWTDFFNFPISVHWKFQVNLLIIITWLTNCQENIEVDVLGPQLASQPARRS